MGGVGPGQFENRTFTAPGVGTLFAFSMPANELWRVISFHYRLAANATVANRRPYLRFDPATGAAQPCNQLVQYVQTASTTVDGWMIYGGSISMTATVAYVGALAGVTALGEFWCTPGGTLVLGVEALQAGDQISVVEGYFQVFLV